MEINIRGDKITITEAMKEQIKSKFGRLEKYFDTPDTMNVYVNIKINNTSQIIEVTIHNKGRRKPSRFICSYRFSCR